MKVLYNVEDYVVGLDYKGLDMQGLEIANERFGSTKFDEPAMGCSITFAKYVNGKIGAVRNMDLHLSKYCSYEFKVHAGENTKHPFWGLAYLGVDEKSYIEMLEQGMSDKVYKAVPFFATDTMSFGKNKKGEKAALYCAVLMRSNQYDDEGNLIWRCPGTYPGAKYRCCTESVPAMFASNCISIEEALKMVGAVDEDYKRIFPNVEPQLDVYSLNSELSSWFEAVAMEDSTGRHGVLEFIDNMPIWHEGIAYSFNYFLQKDYLYNEDGTYKEQYGSGIGRYEATVPFLNRIYTIGDHVSLMESISYSHMTYYYKEGDYIGRDFIGRPVDWRGDEAGTDIWKLYIEYHKAGLDTSIADNKYKLWANYVDKNTGRYVKISSKEEYLANIDHLGLAWTMNYVMAAENRDEIMNYIRWSGLFMNTLTPHEISLTKSGWETFFKVVCDPMSLKVTRWFNENVTTADTIMWDSMVEE